MLALASILSAFAALACLYFRSPEGTKSASFAQSPHIRRALYPAATVGLAASLALAVTGAGWAAGIGLWLAALMVSGVAVVSIAGSHPVLALRLGCCSAAIGFAIVSLQWAVA